MNSSTIHPHERPCWHMNVSWGEFFASASFPFSSDFSQSHDVLSTLYLGVLMYMVALILASSLSVVEFLNYPHSVCIWLVAQPVYPSGFASLGISHQTQAT